MMQGQHSCSFVYTQSIPQSLTQFFLPQTNEVGRKPLFEGQSTQEFERKRHALVVDDVSDVTEMLSVLLRHAGYEVVTADSAPAALAAARKHQFDIIISDIGMPEMNGYQLAKALRSQPGYETVPMVAVTGYSMFDDRERSLQAGFNAHLTKPIEPRALLDLIEHL
ncbi:MAG: response regulator [Pyrinomonadaceae bacterium]